MIISAGRRAIIDLLLIVMNRYYKRECVKTLEQMYEYY